MEKALQYAEDLVDLGVPPKRIRVAMTASGVLLRVLDSAEDALPAGLLAQLHQAEHAELGNSLDCSSQTEKAAAAKVDESSEASLVLCSPESCGEHDCPMTEQIGEREATRAVAVMAALKLPETHSPTQSATAASAAVATTAGAAAITELAREDPLLFALWPARLTLRLQPVHVPPPQLCVRPEEARCVVYWARSCLRVLDNAALEAAALLARLTTRDLRVLITVEQCVVDDCVSSAAPTHGHGARCSASLARQSFLRMSAVHAFAGALRVHGVACDVLVTREDDPETVSRYLASCAALAVVCDDDSLSLAAHDAQAAALLPSSLPRLPVLLLTTRMVPPERIEHWLAAPRFAADWAGLLDTFVSLVREAVGSDTSSTGCEEDFPLTSSPCMQSGEGVVVCDMAGPLEQALSAYFSRSAVPRWSEADALALLRDVLTGRQEATVDVLCQLHTWTGAGVLSSARVLTVTTTPALMSAEVAERAVRRVAERELAWHIHRLLSTSSTLYSGRRDRAGVLARTVPRVDWLALFPDQLHCATPLSSSRGTAALFPAGICAADTTDERFNCVQRGLVLTGEICDEESLRYWLSYLMGHLPTPRMGVKHALYELACHSLHCCSRPLSHAEQCVRLVRLALDERDEERGSGTICCDTTADEQLSLSGLNPRNDDHHVHF